MRLFSLRAFVKISLLVFLLVALSGQMWLRGQGFCALVGPAGGCFLDTPPDVELMDDGRMIKVLRTFSDIDASNVEWSVPRGLISDGASIPRIFWSSVGGPLEGEYRNAAIVHDQACKAKFHTWQDTHMAFYNAMLDSDVNPLQAKIFYLAVYYRGPRWKALKQGFGGKEEMEKEIQEFRASHHNDSKLDVNREPRYLAGPVLEKYTITEPLPPVKVRDKKLNELSKQIEEREANGQPMSIEEIQKLLK